MRDPAQLIADVKTLFAEPLLYKGLDNNTAAMEAHLRIIWEKTSRLIFKDTPFTASEQSLKTLTEALISPSKQNHPQIKCNAATLRDGRIMMPVIYTLLNDRLTQELGPTIECQDITFQALIRLAKIKPIGVSGNELIFGSVGVLLFDAFEKSAAIAHEAGHVKLGHTDRQCDLGKDRRQAEFDTDYIGALIHRGGHDLASVLVQCLQWDEVIKPLVRGADMPQLLKEKFYAFVGKTPRQDPEFDGFIKNFFYAMAQHSRSHAWIYPTVGERVEELMALDIQLKAQDEMLKSWAPEAFEAGKEEMWQRRVQNAVETKHINTSNNGRRNG